MRILTYKRTHVGDPDLNGRFGVNTCMGKIRDYAYDAVIGVGGTGVEPKSHGIDGRINWVGIGPTRRAAPTKRAREVTFDYFLYLEEEGPLLSDMAPSLAKRLYNTGARFILKGYNTAELEEAHHILEWSKTQRSSKTAGLNQLSENTGYAPKVHQRKCGCKRQLATPRDGRT